MNFIGDPRITAARNAGIIGAPRAMQRSDTIGSDPLPPIGEPLGSYGTEPPSRGSSEPVPPVSFGASPPPMPSVPPPVSGYPAGRGGVNVPQYPGGRGLVSSTAPGNSGNTASHLFDSLTSNLGGMTDPNTASQNSQYWIGINGPGLSNPGFYPGGGTATSLQTPGGSDFNAMGSRASSVGNFMNNKVGPLTPGLYNAVESNRSDAYGGTGVKAPSYQNYLSSFPKGNNGAPLLGGRGGALGGGRKVF